MKVLSVPQIREADAYTIAQEPVASIDLMERAARACKNRITAGFDLRKRFVIVCGNGNNGGDGLAVARMLLQENQCRIKVVLVPVSANPSADFSVNLARLKEILPAGDWITPSAGDTRTRMVYNPHTDIIIDAIFGSGLSRPAEGLAAAAIGEINRSGCPVIAIDIPSGLYGDDNTGNYNNPVVHAAVTLTFQAPKLAYFFAENAVFTGSVTVLDIGLHPAFLQSVSSPYTYFTQEDAEHEFRARAVFSHKGSFGHALIVSGSRGKMGAAVLAATACLRSGAGLLTVMAPKCGYTVLQAAVPEAMVTDSDAEDWIYGRIPAAKHDAVGIGPGIGLHEDTVRAFKILIQDQPPPLVIDADALNILAENPTWLSFLPGGSILTPHPGEFDRLFGKHSSGFERMKTQREMAKKFGLYLVLKGAYTSVAFPDGQVFFNSTGNPAMATAGSGDVLTGVITALRAQGYGPAEAAVLGVFLHGRAGDIASAQGPIIARDIVHALPAAFHSLVRTNS